jgi:hypothetical protein
MNQINYFLYILITPKKSGRSYKTRIDITMIITIIILDKTLYSISISKIILDKINKYKI